MLLACGCTVAGIAPVSAGEVDPDIGDGVNPDAVVAPDIVAALRSGVVAESDAGAPRGAVAPAGAAATATGVGLTTDATANGGATATGATATGKGLSACGQFSAIKNMPIPHITPSENVRILFIDLPS